MPKVVSISPSPGSCCRAENDRRLKEENPCWAQEIKSLSSSAPLEERGILQACRAHVLTSSALPTWLKIGECGTICLCARTITLHVCACSHTQPMCGSRCPTEPHAHRVPACATVGSPVHPPACACSCAHSCVGEHVCSMDVCNWVCKYRGVCLRVGLCMCAQHTRVHMHTSVRVAGCAHACIHKRAGAPLCELVWERVGGQRACQAACAVPRHHQMVPCLHVTFWGPKPAPCGRTWRVHGG